MLDHILRCSLQNFLNTAKRNVRRSKMPLCGGVGEIKDANEEVHDICSEIKAEAEQQAGTTFDTFKATTYATQVVAGTNFFIKVDVGSDKFVHLRVFRGLPHAPGLKLHSLQMDKGKEDALDYF